MSLRSNNYIQIQVVALSADAEMLSSAQGFILRYLRFFGAVHIPNKTNLCAALPLQWQGGLMDVN